MAKYYASNNKFGNYNFLTNNCVHYLIEILKYSKCESPWLNMYFLSAGVFMPTALYRQVKSRLNYYSFNYPTSKISIEKLL